MGSALAQDQRVQVDILTGKITALIKANKHTDALPYFKQLEALNVALPEGFYYFYVDALDKAGQAQPAVERGNLFLSKYGRTSKYYKAVVGIVSRRSIELDKINADAAAEAIRQEANAAEKKRRCVVSYNDDLESAEQQLQQAEAACERSTYPGNSFCFGNSSDGRDNQRAEAWSAAQHRLNELKSGSQCS